MRTSTRHAFQDSTRTGNHRASPSPAMSWNSPLPTVTNTVLITDTVLHDLDTILAAPDPERGGALLRPVNGDAITEFIWDDAAETTTVSYVPSNELNVRVAEIESSLDMVLAGVVHSHPNGLNALSGPDLDVTRNLLRTNRHLGWACMPIVTQLDDTTPLGMNELSLPHGRVSFFVARLDGVDNLQLGLPAMVRILPIGRLIEHMADVVKPIESGVQERTINGTTMRGIWFRLPDDSPTFWILISDDFPLAGPLMAVEHEGALIPLPVAATPSGDVGTAIDSVVDTVLSVVDQYRSTTPIETGENSEIESKDSQGFDKTTDNGSEDSSTTAMTTEEIDLPSPEHQTATNDIDESQTAPLRK